MGFIMTTIAGVAGDTLYGTDSNDDLNLTQMYRYPFFNYPNGYGGFYYGVYAVYRVSAGWGSDLVTGTTYSDRLDGGAGSDTISAGGGSDVIEGGDGADSISGGDGDDLIIDSGYAYLRDDTIDGGDGADTIRAGSGNDDVTGGIGRDSLNGESGDDTIHGGADADTIDGGSSWNGDWLYGDEGADSITAGYGADWIDGGIGGDTVVAGSGADTIFGGADGDNLQGQWDNDRIYGEAGFDTLDGGQGDDYLAGGWDNDTLIGGTGNDTLSGDTGDDQFRFDGPYDGFDVIDGGSDRDIILASSYGTVIGLKSVTGIEVISAPGNSNVQILGDGSRNVFDFTNVTLTNITKISGGAGDDIILGSSSSADFVSGDDGNDYIGGGDGDDTLAGGTGDDTLVGETSGLNQLDGGVGYDLAVYQGTRADYQITSSGTTTTVRRLIGGIVDGRHQDTLVDVEAVRFGDGTTLTLNNPPSAPTDFDGAANSVAENAAAGTYVGYTARSTDPEGQSVNYFLLDDAGGRFAIDPVSGRVTLRDPRLIDFETATSHTIRVAASDGLNTAASMVVIQVQNGNDAPTLVTDVNTLANAVKENAVVGASVGVTLRATDPDANALTYVLTDTAGGRFRVDPVTGVVTVANGALLDYEIAQSYTITGHAVDNGTPQLAGPDQTFTIAIKDVFDPLTWAGTEGADRFTATTDTQGWVLDGKGGDDSIVGSALADNITGGTGNDTIDGGAGVDTVVLSGRRSEYKIALDDDGAVVVTRTATGERDIVTNVEFFKFTDGTQALSAVLPANLFIRGTTGPDKIAGGNGLDTLIGAAGNDTISGGDGRDLILGDDSAGLVSSIRRVSVNARGEQGSGWTYDPVFSPDGKYIAFASEATNLVSPGVDTNGTIDVFLKDLTSGEVTIISIASGSVGNGMSLSPTFSRDGRYIAFKSYASNMFSNDYNGGSDIFVKDLVTGQIFSATTSYGNFYNTNPDNPAFLGDSTTLMFSVYGSGWGSNILLSDFMSSERKSVPATWSYSYYYASPTASADGQLIAFSSTDPNIVSGDYNASRDIFLYNAQNGVISIASRNSSGQLTNGNSLLPTLSPDGRYLTFISAATNLDPAATNGTNQLYLKNLQTGAVTLLSKNADGISGDAQSGAAVFSSNGRYVAFWSSASNLISGANALGGSQIYIRDLLTNEIAVVSTNSSGEFGNGESDQPVFSADGKSIAFRSTSSNLVADDTNGSRDIFVKDIASVFSSAGNDSMSGGAGRDTIIGSGGDDSLDGGSGADSLVGGLGNDRYVVDDTGDIVVEYASQGTDGVNSSISYTLAANFENLTLTGAAAINGVGNELANYLTGNGAANRLDGGAGNDTLVGGLGADTLVGGSGNDDYVVDDALDVVVESAGEGTDTLQSSLSYILQANFENLTLIGNGRHRRRRQRTR